MKYGNGTHPEKDWSGEIGSFGNVTLDIRTFDNALLPLECPEEGESESCTSVRHRQRCGACSSLCLYNFSSSLLQLLIMSK